MGLLERIAGGDKPERLGDIVFIEALRGDPFATWAADPSDIETWWLRWLRTDLEAQGIDVDVWSLAFDGSQFPWEESVTPLVEPATQALAMLDSEGIGSRPIVFVAHSLGGILLKQVFQSAQNSGDSRWMLIAEQTQGIVFLSTPHNGPFLDGYLEFLGTFLSRPSLRESRGSHLWDLTNWFTDVAFPRIRTERYHERKTTRWRGADRSVVDKVSVKTFPDDVVPMAVPVDADHFTITKPESRESPLGKLLYRRVLRFVRECLPANGESRRATFEGSTTQPIIPAPPANVGARGDKVNEGRGNVAILRQPLWADQGEVRIAFGTRLGDSWRDLSNTLGIPDAVRRLWERSTDRTPGDFIWEHLDHRTDGTREGGLWLLPEALAAIGREDLSRLFEPIRPKF